MEVSVVVCTYAEQRYPDFREAVESVLGQTYDAVEVVAVIDGNDTVCQRVHEDFGSHDDVVIHCNDAKQGVSVSRTRGAELAGGDVVAFIDDDAIAESDWVERLVRAYEEYDAIAVGGRMAGEWLAGRPWFLPEEFNWLVGVTHRGFAEPYEEVRNTFESNISFRREVFLALGGYNPELGPTATAYSHSEGAELGARLRAEYDRGVVYVPDAVVRHKVFEERTQFRWLCRRAFEQGVSKRSMEGQPGGSSAEEFGFLRALLVEHAPRRLRALITGPSGEQVGQLGGLVLFTGLVGIGYVYEAVRSVVSG